MSLCPLLVSVNSKSIASIVKSIASIARLLLHFCCLVSSPRGGSSAKGGEGSAGTSLRHTIGFLVG